VLAVLLLWFLFLPPNSAVQPGVQRLWTLGNLANFYTWKHLGLYWGDAADWAPLTHCWSLGIEEQFYLIFPGTLLLLGRLQIGSTRFWLSLVAILSFGLCWYGTKNHPIETFYLLPTRLWELLLGAILAHRSAQHAPVSVPRWTSFSLLIWNAVGWIGLVTILGGYFFVDGGRGFPDLAALAPTLGAGLVIISLLKGATSLSRFLSTPFMRQTGKLSYSLYLWHWPLIIFGKLQAAVYGFSESSGAMIGGLGGIILAWGAYACVERPLRRRGAGRPWRLSLIGISPHISHWDYRVEKRAMMRGFFR